MNQHTFTKEEFEAKRLLSDKLADELALQIHQGNPSEVLKLFRNLETNRDLENTKFPPFLEEYFTKTDFPDWVDWKKIKLGQKVFSKYGDAISLLLFYKSLPQCYCCAKGAQVMYKTQRFVEHDKSFDVFTKRLVETAQYVVNILSEDGFSPEGKALVTAKKVRLIHATIRYYIRKGEWDTSILGEPINQQDLAGTLMSFSSLILQGLEQLNLNLSEVEKDAYIHIWKLAGHLNGIDEDLLPNNYTHALELQQAILKDQTAYSPEGKELIESLIKYVEYVIPGNAFDGIAIIMVRYFLGEENASLMKIPEENNLVSDITEKLVKFSFDIKEKAMDSSQIVNFFFEKMSKLFLQGMMNYYNEFEQVHFYLPKSLRKDWNIEIWEDVWKTPSIGGYRLNIQKKD